MKKIIITGAGGFLGRNIIESCLKHNDLQVLAISSQKESLSCKFKSEQLEIDSCAEALQRDWDNIDTLINCAFPRTSDGNQIALGLKYINDVLNKSVENKVGSVINISSQSVYSQKRINAASEMTMYSLESPYAIGKYVTELMTNSICKDIRHTNIRMASLIGPGFEQRIVNKLVKQALNGENLNIKGGNQKFGFLDVLDAAKAILKVACDDESWEEAYNLGIEGSYSLLEIAECVKQVCQEYGIMIQIDVEKSNDWQNSELDCKKMYERFNWKPHEDLRSSVRRIIQGYKK